VKSADRPTDALVAEQIRYYRERAGEYDATSRPTEGRFAAIEKEILADLRRHGPVGRAIELGAGTGAFTEVVAEIARKAIAVDSSPEMLDINRSRVTAPNVERVVADVFEWVPDEPADLVVFAYLLSHVPAERFDAFWAAVGRLVRPGGGVFVSDEARHGLWQEEASPELDDGVVYRTLNDGRRFRIVKVLWDPDELTDRLASLGWSAELRRQDPFYWGTISRRRPPDP
jgi:ubiquinone/menaquinone biosynthesis C-methylase UbiE